MRKLCSLFLLITGLIACDSNEPGIPKPDIKLPELVTTDITAVTQTEAVSGGVISNIGNVAVIAKGVVWGTASSPTVALTTRTNEGGGTSSFTSQITNLLPATVYFVRAYATTDEGTAYGEEKTFTSLAVAESGVYLAVQLQGGVNRAYYWKDAEVLPLSDGSRQAFAKSITVNSGGVYVAGNEHNTSAKYVARYWKDGIPVDLSDGSRHAFADGIAVSGADVYVAGSEQTAQQRRAKYWVNGIESNLTDGSKHAVANGICVADSKVYVSGFMNEPMETARYWTNGTETILPQSTNAVRSVANGIFVSGADVYVSGYQQISFNGTGRYVATVWKNGAITLLGNTNNNSYATGVSVKDNEVYVSGYENELGVNVAKYWKNGTAVNLSDGSIDEHTASIFISTQGDVYVSGYSGNVNSGIQAKYWKNGVAHTNNSGTYAWSICVF